jgi:hypothetical protein
MNGKILNWNKFDKNNPKHIRSMMVHIHEFLAAPASPAFRAEVAKALEFTTSADFPTSVLPVLQKYHLTDNFDTSYEEIFDIIDITNSRRNGIEVSDVQDALVFEKTLEGEKAKVYQASGSKVSLTCDMYSGGLSWSRRLLDDEEWWNIEDNVISFRNKFYAGKAANFYALIDALGAGYNVTWQNPVPSTLPDTADTFAANKDIQTLNYAAAAILTAVKDKGYGVTPQNASFVVLTPLALVSRLRQALGLNLQAFSGSPAFVNFNFRVIPTLMLSATDKYYVILPKNKLKGLNRMDLTPFDQFDPWTYSDVRIGWARYGGGILDSAQLRRCSIA